MIADELRYPTRPLVVRVAVLGVGAFGALFLFVAVAAGTAGAWSATLVAGLSALFFFWLACRATLEVVLEGDGTIAARGLFWHVDSNASNVRRIVIYQGAGRKERAIYVDERRWRIVVSNAIAEELRRRNPAIKVKGRP